MRDVGSDVSTSLSGEVTGRGWEVEVTSVLLARWYREGETVWEYCPFQSRGSSRLRGVTVPSDTKV